MLLSYSMVPDSFHVQRAVLLDVPLVLLPMLRYEAQEQESPRKGERYGRLIQEPESDAEDGGEGAHQEDLLPEMLYVTPRVSASPRLALPPHPPCAPPRLPSHTAPRCTCSRSATSSHVPSSSTLRGLATHPQPQIASDACSSLLCGRLFRAATGGSFAAVLSGSCGWCSE